MSCCVAAISCRPCRRLACHLAPLAVPAGGFARSFSTATLTHLISSLERHHACPCPLHAAWHQLRQSSIRRDVRGRHRPRRRRSRITVSHHWYASRSSAAALRSLTLGDVADILPGDTLAQQLFGAISGSALSAPPNTQDAAGDVNMNGYDANNDPMCWCIRAPQLMAHVLSER